MSYKPQQKKGRTLAITINELFESPRLKLAVQLFDKDPLLLKALFVELGLESLNVGKNTVIKKYNVSSGLDKFEVVPMLRQLSLDDFMTFNVHWSLSEIEIQLYLAKINGASKEELEDLVDKVNNKLGISKLLNKKKEQDEKE